MGRSNLNDPIFGSPTTTEATDDASPVVAGDSYPALQSVIVDTAATGDYVDVNGRSAANSAAVSVRIPNGNANAIISAGAEITVTEFALVEIVTGEQSSSDLEIVRYTADGPIEDKDHRAIFETGAVNMTLSASTTNRLIQMVSEGPTTVITADGTEQFTSGAGTSADSKLTLNETFKWATIVGRTAAGWSQYVGQIGLPAGVDESTPTKFKAGTRLVQNGIQAGASGGSVTFPEAFKAGTIPTVIPVAHATGDNVNVTLQAVTNTGFTSWVVRNESDVGQNNDVHWIAIGDTA